MNIITKTTLETDLDAIQAQADNVIRLCSTVSDVLNRSYWTLWNLPDDRLLAILNHLGAAKVNDIFTAHNTLGNALNAATNGFGIAAIVEPDKEIAYSDGIFTIVYPEPEIEQGEPE